MTATSVTGEETEEERALRRRELSVLRLAHLAQAAAWGLVVAFEALLLRRRGLGPSDIGTVLLVIQAVALVSGFLWGALADRTGRMRALALIGSLAFAATLFYGARAEGLSHFLVYAVLRGVTQPMVLALMPALAVAVLPERGRGRAFASYRVFGPIGYVLGTLTVPLLLDDVGEYLTAAALAMALAALPLVFGRVRVAPRPRQTGFLRALKTPAVAVFLASMFFFATAQQAAFFYLPAYADALGASERVIGALTSMNGLLGLAAVPLMGRLADRGGARTVLLLALACQPLRMLGVAAASDSEQLFLPQLLHLVVFAGPELAAVLYITDVTPAADRGASMALLLAVLVAGMAVGAKACGLVAELWGFRTMYLAAAGSSAVGALLFAGYATGAAAISRSRAAGR